MYHVYILLNETKMRTYTGVSDDVDKRLEEHNAGRVKSSRPYRPYKIIHTESFATLLEARRKEKFCKSTTGRRRLKGMLFKA
jgi:putative endonuclease